MKKQSSQDSARFTSHQTVCIEARKALLYSEVIQVVVERQSCWARPLLLVKFNDPNPRLDIDVITREQIVDLRESSDLLLPIGFFRPALDTEIIPLISQLNNLDLSPKKQQVAREYLNRFIKQVWQENFSSN